MSRAGAEKDPLRKNWQQQATRMCQSECYMMFASIYIALNSSALLFRLAFFHGHIHTTTNEIVYISVCSYPCTQKANMWFHFGLKNSIPNDMCNEPSIGFLPLFISIMKCQQRSYRCICVNCYYGFGTSLHLKVDIPCVHCADEQQKVVTYSPNALALLYIFRMRTYLVEMLNWIFGQCRCIFRQLHST